MEKGGAFTVKTMCNKLISVAHTYLKGINLDALLFNLGGFRTWYIVRGPPPLPPGRLIELIYLLSLSTLELKLDTVFIL